MQSGDLTAAQAEKVREALMPHVRYLLRLKTRMEKRGFPPGDALFERAVKAYDASQSLYMALHYLSCKSGVGKAPKER